MKKLLLITAAALLLSVCAFAQEFGGWQRGERPDEATMVKMRTDRMVRQLGLDETQAAKLLELNQKYPNVMMGGRPGGPGMGRPPRGERPEEFVPPVENQDNATVDKKAKKKAKKEQKKKAKEADKAAMDEQMKEMEANREAYEAELKEILTEDQYKSWEEFKNSRPQGPGGRPGGFGPGGPGGGRPGGGFGGPGGGFGGPGGFGGGDF